MALLPFQKRFFSKDSSFKELRLGSFAASKTTFIKGFVFQRASFCAFLHVFALSSRHVRPQTWRVRAFRRYYQLYHISHLIASLFPNSLCFSRILCVFRRHLRFPPARRPFILFSNSLCFLSFLVFFSDFLCLFLGFFAFFLISLCFSGSFAVPCSQQIAFPHRTCSPISSFCPKSS